MAQGWLTIKVELLSGRGQEFWPPPGRMVLVGPRHTFQQLGEVVDQACARWDPAHLRMFTLQDGTTVTDEETAEEFGSVAMGPAPGRSLELSEKVVDHVGEGSEFRYVFDFGDDWTHSCTVDEVDVAPTGVVGHTPRAPFVFWGWGSMPDQYGRRWADDDGESPVPARPQHPHPMVTGDWPDREPADPVDLQELRGAVARRDASAIRKAVEGRDVDDVLQLLGEASLLMLALDREGWETFALMTYNRLGLRGAEGDDVLAEDLLAALREEPPDARYLPVDLGELEAELHGSPDQMPGFLDLKTGEVLPEFLTDPGMVGEDASVDVEEEPDRWLELDRLGSRAGWEDMAAFAGRVRDERTRERLEHALEGKGAFRRFRDAVHDEGLMADWHRYADDRAIGRARAYLADRGIRVRYRP